MTDHTPSPATDGLRDLIEKAREWVRYADESPHLDVFGSAWMHNTIIRGLAALDPAVPSETATDCEDGVFGSQEIADALGGRGPRPAPPVSSDEDRADKGNHGPQN